MIEDVNERNEREMCEYGRILTEDERRELGARDAQADASAAELRAQREAENLEREKHREEFGHYPTQLPCLKCQAQRMHKRDGAEPQQLHGDAIECPQCKHVMLKSEVADYRAHGQNCLAYEIRTRRNEATMSELAKRLVYLEDANKRLEAQLQLTEAQKLAYDGAELKVSLLALARHVLTPGQCLAPDAPMYCGGSDLCPNCSTTRTFHGDCGILKELKELLNEAIQKPKKPTTIEELGDVIAALEKKLEQTEKLASSAHAGAYPQGFGR